MAGSDDLTMTAEAAGAALGLHWRTVCMLARHGHLRMRIVRGETRHCTHAGHGPLGRSAYGYAWTPVTFYLDPAEVEAVRPRAAALAAAIAIANQRRLAGLIAEALGGPEEAPADG